MSTGIPEGELRFEGGGGELHAYRAPAVYAEAACHGVRHHSWVQPAVAQAQRALGPTIALTPR